MYTTHHHKQRLTSLRKSAVDSQKYRLTGGGELEPQSCTIPATGACRESSESSTSSHPHSGAHSCSASPFALFSRPQFRAVDTKLSYRDSASSVCHDSQPCEKSPAPCPACLVISSPTKQGLQHLREGDICLAFLSLGSVHWLLFCNQQRIPLEGNAQACLLFSFTVHSPYKAIPPFTSPFVLAQARQVAILG